MTIYTRIKLGFYRVPGRHREKRYLGRRKACRRFPVQNGVEDAAGCLGTRFSGSPSMKGLVTVGWLRLSVGDDGPLASFGSGSGAGSGLDAIERGTGQR